MAFFTAMQVPITRERETIDQLFQAHNWAALEALGIRDLKREPSTSDCGHYVLDIIGVPSNLEMVEALERLATTPIKRDGIVLYKQWGPHGMRTMHYGIITGDSVKSKWGPESPILEHPFLLVPASYGAYAEFCGMKKAREYFMERRQQTIFGPDYY